MGVKRNNRHLHRNISDHGQIAFPLPNLRERWIIDNTTDAVYVRHRACPQSPLCTACSADDAEAAVKQNRCSNAGLCGKWKKCLLLPEGTKDPRPTSPEGMAQKKKYGYVTFNIFMKPDNTYCYREAYKTQKYFST